MPLVKRFAGCSSALIAILCLSCSLISLRGCSDQLTSTFGPGSMDYDPGDATCDNAGVAYADNPFSGWPLSAGWADVSYYYCAADYYVRFGRTHWGIDIAKPTGNPVWATADATVIRTSYDTTTGMGRNVKICTPTGWCATYMHLDGFNVETGDEVNQGDVLGWIDNTGFSTGPHLHYQLNNPAGQPVDPAPTMGG
jgi:murein DD-endopeptidase MepM/ murein hydrolase activator NlpD